MGDSVVAVLGGGQFRQAAHGVEVLAPLLVDEGDLLGETGLRCEREFHEELVPYPRLVLGLLVPGAQRLAPGVGEVVDLLVGPARLLDFLAFDQSRPLEAAEGHVYLADVRLRVRGAQQLLKVLLQLVAMGGAAREECQEGQAHSCCPPSLRNTLQALVSPIPNRYRWPLTPGEGARRRCTGRNLCGGYATPVGAFSS